MFCINIQSALTQKFPEEDKTPHHLVVQESDLLKKRSTER